MKNYFPLLTILAFLLSTVLIGCEAIGGIFKAGVWTGVLGVILLIVAVAYFMGRSKKG